MATNPSADARRNATWICASSALPGPAMFSRIERCSSVASWATMEIWARKLSCVTSVMSAPSILIVPDSASWNRSSRATSVDLPAPDRPTMPTRSPAATSRFSRSSPPRPRP
jgi:hypothetical protein